MYKFELLIMVEFHLCVLFRPLVLNVFAGVEAQGDIPAAQGPLFTHFHRRIKSYC